MICCSARMFLKSNCIIVVIHIEKIAVFCINSILQKKCWLLHTQGKRHFFKSWRSMPKTLILLFLIYWKPYLYAVVIILFYNMHFKIKISMLLFDTIFVLVFFLQKLSNDMTLS